MSEPHLPVLEQEDKLLILTRRLFRTDLRRHFVGVVERFDQGAVRVRGYAFVYDTTQGGFIRRKTQRTRVFLLDNHIILYVLPFETEIPNVHFEVDKERGLIVTDGRNFKLEMSEFNA